MHGFPVAETVIRLGAAEAVFRPMHLQIWICLLYAHLPASVKVCIGPELCDADSITEKTCEPKFLLLENGFDISASTKERSVVEALSLRRDHVAVAQGREAGGKPKNWNVLRIISLFNDESPFRQLIVRKG
jgi:hypothetical protein